MALTGALAASQLLTLLFLWPRTPHQGADAPRSPFAPAPPVAVQPPADPGSWAMNRRLLNDADDLPPPAASDSYVPDDPPLRASSVQAALIN